MNRFLLLLIFFCLGKTLSAQHVYTIKADSVKITNNCDTAELIIENHTQNVPGFLFNKGSGRTEFRQGLVKLNDSLYSIGADSLKIPQPPVITASEGLKMVGNSVQLGGALASNRSINMNGYNMLFYNGSIRCSTEVTGASSGALLRLNPRWNTTGSPTALSVDVVNTASSSNAQLLNIGLRNGTGALTSSFNIKPNGGRLYMEFYDSTGDYLHIRSNNIMEGSYNLPFVDGVITLTGSYVPSAGSGIICGIMDQSQYAPTGGSFNYCSYRIIPNLFNVVPPAGKIQGIYYNVGFLPGSAIPNNSNIAFENYNGNVLLNNQAGDAGGRTAIHINQYDPTAWLHLGAGINTAKGAPLKFTGGQVLDIPENGAVEYDGTDLYLTTGSVRYKLSKTLTGEVTTNFNGSPLAALNAVTTNLFITGVKVGDVVVVNGNTGTVNPPSIIFTANVTAANTVTLRAYNAGNTAVTIASDTYKVKVIK